MSWPGSSSWYVLSTYVRVRRMALINAIINTVYARRFFSLSQLGVFHSLFNFYELTSLRFSDFREENILSRRSLPSYFVWYICTTVTSCQDQGLNLLPSDGRVGTCPHSQQTKNFPWIKIIIGGRGN